MEFYGCREFSCGLTLKAQSRLQQMTFINTVHCFSEKIRFDCEVKMNSDRVISNESVCKFIFYFRRTT